TGSIPQAATLTITAKVQTPAGGVLGNANTAILTAQSKMDPSRSMTASLKTAVPAPFVEGLEEDYYAVSLDLAQPRSQVFVDVPGTCGCGQNEMAIAKMTGETYIYAWWNAQWVAPVPHSDMVFTILDNTGSTILPATRLTINDAVTTQTYDLSPAVAVTPDGHIGILWRRQVYNSDASQLTVNLFFAILDASGQVVWGPTNITNDSTWIAQGSWTETYMQNQVSATGDNHFLLAWQHATQDGGGTELQIDYAVRDSAGNSVKDSTQLPASGVDMNSGISANAVSGNRTILTWLYNSDIYYAMLDSAGTVSKAEANLTNNGQARGGSHAVLLSDGKTALAWINYDGSYPGKNQLAFAILDGSLNLLWGPISLNNPAAAQGNGGISITADGQAHAIITWSGSGNHEMYYALVNSGGTVITAPMAFLSTRNPQNGFQVNGLGYGNAPYDITTPPTVVSINRADASPTSATSVNFTVKFSEPVTGVDASDFTFNTSGISGAAVTGISGSHATYTVTVSTGIGDGTLGLNLIDNDSIIDASGNPLGGTGAGNGDFTTGQTYSITGRQIFLPLVVKD
ncbi:MAG TPA: hypothetical protein VMT91_03735, partial [Anaerolineales bacterium]|nr:hypothetical protein [Anaerolineales bacterium]